jgi:LacI family transcriptional regulator
LEPTPKVKAARLFKAFIGERLLNKRKGPVILPSQNQIESSSYKKTLYIYFFTELYVTDCIMKVKKEVTIYDIAQKLALSTATVSRGLQDNPAINKNTRKKIQEAAKELGYRHNSFASNLRKQTTNTIGVIVHELNSNFITSVLTGIEKVTTEAGYDLIIAHSSESFEKEAANSLNLFHKRVDGLIASLAFNTQGLKHFQHFADKGIPVIFFDRVEENSDSTKVVIDNYKCGYQATQHLIQQGCKRIVLVTASLKRNVYAQRHKGYIDALYDNNIPYNKNWVLIKDLSEQCGVEAALEILKMKPMPDGAFITNDFSAAVCMQTLKEHGMRIPDDIAIVGFNNDAICKLVEPQMTTINYPGLDVGEIAARNLINHLNGTSNISTTNTIVVRSELIIRKSSLKNNSPT